MSKTYTVIVLRPACWLEVNPEEFPTAQSLQYVASVVDPASLHSAGMQGREQAFWADVNDGVDLHDLKESDYEVLGVINENGQYMMWLNGERP